MSSRDGQHGGGGLRASKHQSLRGARAGLPGVSSGEGSLPGMSQLLGLLGPQVGAALGPLSGDALGRGWSPIGVKDVRPRRRRGHQRVWWWWREGHGGGFKGERPGKMGGVEGVVRAWGEMSALCHLQSGTGVGAACACQPLPQEQCQARCGGTQSPGVHWLCDRFLGPPESPLALTDSCWKKL